MPSYKRKVTEETPSPTGHKRQKGSLNSFSCDACKKSKIKCQPVTGQDQCVACAKRGPQQVCVRTGIDNRSNDTTAAKLNAMCEAFKSIYDDYLSVFYHLFDHRPREVENMCLMLRVSTPTTYLPASSKEKLQNQIYPSFCHLMLEDLRLAQMRTLKESFSTEAWSYIRKLQALLDAFIRGQLSEEAQHALLAALTRIQTYGIPCDIIKELQRGYPTLVLDPAAYEDNMLLADYKNKLVHELGLNLDIKTPEPETKRSVSNEVIDLTESPPAASTSPMSPTPLTAPTSFSGLTLPSIVGGGLNQYTWYPAPTVTDNAWSMESPHWAATSPNMSAPEPLFSAPGPLLSDEEWERILMGM